MLNIIPWWLVGFVVCIPLVAFLLNLIADWIGEFTSGKR